MPFGVASQVVAGASGDALELLCRAMEAKYKESWGKGCAKDSRAPKWGDEKSELSGCDGRIPRQSMSFLDLHAFDLVHWEYQTISIHVM